MRSSISLPLIALALLAGCRTPPAEAPAPNKAAQQTETLPVPANYQVLSGSLIGIPAGAEVELALLEVNARSRPARMLGDVRLRAQGNEQSFQLAFDPASFPTGQRVELRGRVVQSGQLSMRLPVRTITLASSQSVGQLQAIPTP
jgi:uncharacterized lipoprotein YbaY